MNKLQKVFSAITGYAGIGVNHSDAHDTYYYELETEAERKTQIKNYAENAFDESIYLTQDEVNKIYAAIERYDNAMHDGNYSLNQDNAYLSLED